MQRYDPDSPGGGRWPPPDIEGMLRDLGERFRGLDGRLIAAGAGVVLLVILLWSSWFTVQPEETGVVPRVGGGGGGGARPGGGGGRPAGGAGPSFKTPGGVLKGGATAQPCGRPPRTAGRRR